MYLYGPLVTGLSYPDYWERKASGWELRAHYATDINFAAVLQASRTPVTSMPRLQIALSDGYAVVSRPAGASYFELLTSSRAAGLPWTVVGSGIFTAGDSYVLTNNVGPGATGWFRLRRLE